MSTPSRRFALTVLCAPLLLACPEPSDDGDDADDAETGSEQQGACFDPGSLLLERARELQQPSPVTTAGLVCSQGWGSDAPMREAIWTADLGDIDDNFAATQLRIHPDGGVVFAGVGYVARISGDGEVLWIHEGPTAISQYTLLVDADGSIIVSAWDWDSYMSQTFRLGADGSELGDVALPLISDYAIVWAMEWLGQDMILGVDDETMDGWDQPTLLRVSAMGEELLRKSNPSVFGRPFAVNQSGTVLFGNPLVSADNGAVLGSLSLSQGNPTAAVGVGDDFYLTGTDGDLVIAQYSAFGNERWLQTYDRAGGIEQGRAVAGTPDGGAAIAGIESLIDFSNTYWYSQQPMVIVVDADGNALWRDRIASPGEASAVAVADDGSVYVAGAAEGQPPGPGQPPALLNWVRKY